MEKYGPEYKELSREVKKKQGYIDQFTGEKAQGDAVSHHQHKNEHAIPGMNHFSSVLDTYRQYIHDEYHIVTNTGDYKTAQKRREALQAFMRDPDNEEALKIIRECDDKLIPEFIRKHQLLPSEMADHFRDRILVTAIGLNRDLMAERYQLTKKLEKAEKTLEKERNKQKAKIIQILDYKHAREE